MRIFAAILIGVLIVVLSVYVSANAFGPKYANEDTRVSYLRFAEHARLPYLYGDSDASIRELHTVFDPERHSRNTGLFAEADLTIQLSQLQSERLKLPPVPGQHSEARNAIKQRYADLDRRIERIQKLRDEVRTVLADEDARRNSSASVEQRSVAEVATATSTQTSRAAADQMTPPDDAHAKAPIPDRKPSTAAPQKDKPPTVFTSIIKATEAFFDYLFDHPHQALRELIVGLFYYLVLLFGIVTGAIYEGIGTYRSKSRSIPLKAVLKFASSPTSWQGLLASPMVFAVVRAAIPYTRLTFAITLLAFQNGFFWRATIKSLQDAAQRRAVKKKADEDP